MDVSPGPIGPVEQDWIETYSADIDARQAAAIEADTRAGAVDRDRVTAAADWAPFVCVLCGHEHPGRDVDWQNGVTWVCECLTMAVAPFRAESMPCLDQTTHGVTP